jgi:hypothetical protein
MNSRTILFGIRLGISLVVPALVIVCLSADSYYGQNVSGMTTKSWFARNADITEVGLPKGKRMLEISFPELASHRSLAGWSVKTYLNKENSTLVHLIELSEVTLVATEPVFEYRSKLPPGTKVADLTFHKGGYVNVALEPFVYPIEMAVALYLILAVILYRLSYFFFFGSPQEKDTGEGTMVESA